MGNSFRILLDFLLQRGLKHSELIDSMMKEIETQYKSKFYDGKDNPNFLIDETEGIIRVYRAEKEITPKDFSRESSIFLVEILTQKIKETEGQKNLSEEKSPLIIGVFWFYNIIFISIIVALSLAFLFDFELRNDLLEMLNNDMAKVFTAIMIILVPIVSIFFSFEKNIGVGDSKEAFSRKIRKIFIFFEIPLIVFLFFILTFFENLNRTNLFFVGIVFLAMLTIPLGLVEKKINDSKLKVFIFAIKEFSFVNIAYLIFVYLFFLPPIFGSIFQEIIDGGLSYFSISSLFFIIPGILFFSLLIFSPFFFVYHNWRSLQKSYLELLGLIGKNKIRTVAGSLIILSIFPFLIIFFSNQDSSYLSKIQKLNELKTFEEQEALAVEVQQNKELVDKEINRLTIYRDQYFFSTEDEAIEEFYEEGLDLGQKASATMGKIFNIIAYPFVYRGSLDEDYEFLEKYNYLTSNKEEMGEEYDFGDSSVNSKNIKLVSRKIRANTNSEGLVARISIEDEFKNTNKYTEEEVIYEFSLPVDAVVNELRLGPDLEFEGVIAPRGAAAKVYEAEVEKARDPALLEQIGLGKYRLRVFPIPESEDKKTLGGKNQKVMFSYTTLAYRQGYPLPNFTSETKLPETNTKFELSLNNTPLDYKNYNDYIPVQNQPFNENPCKNLFSISSQVSQADSVFGKIESYGNIEELRNRYSCSEDGQIDFSNNLEASKFAIIIDTSNKNLGLIEKVKNELKSKKSLLEKNQVDIYFFNGMLSQKNTLEEGLNKNITFFGENKPISAINSLQENYDFIVWINGNQKILNQENKLRVTIPTPIYLISENSKNPNLSQQLIYDVEKNQGGIFENLNLALNHFIISRKLNWENKNNYIYFNPYFAFSLENAGQDDSKMMKTNPDDYVSHLLAKAHLTKISASSKEDLISSESRNFQLDRLNNYADSTSTVTPYSSLIALVNKKQAKRLEKASEKDNRYTDNSVFENKGSNRQSRLLDWGSLPSMTPSPSSTIDNYSSNSLSIPVNNPIGVSSTDSLFGALIAHRIMSIIIFLVLPIIVVAIFRFLKSLIRRKLK